MLVRRGAVDDGHIFCQNVYNEKPSGGGGNFFKGEIVSKIESTSYINI